MRFVKQSQRVVQLELNQVLALTIISILKNQYKFPKFGFQMIMINIVDRITKYEVFFKTVKLCLIQGILKIQVVSDV